MLAIRRQAEAVITSNRELARWGVERVDQLRARREPAVLQEIQERLVREHQDVTRRQSAHRERRGERAGRIKRRFGTSKAVHAARVAHDERLKDFTSALERRRAILFAIGDACAWSAAFAWTPMLQAFSNDDPPPPLPSGVGLAGPMVIARQAHLAGGFLVVLHDLTQCLGEGDLSVWRLDRPGAPPTVFEAKTSGPGPSGKATVGLHALILEGEGGNPDFQRFCEVLGLEGAEAPPLDARGERQLARLEQGALRARDVLKMPAPITIPEDIALWPRVDDAIALARRDGIGFADLMGTYGIAMSLSASRDRARVEAALQAFTREHQVTGNWESASAQDLMKAPHLAASVPPIAIWHLAVESRVELLTGEIQYVAWWPKDLWSTALGKAGIALAAEEWGWRLRFRGEDFNFERSEAARIVLSTAFEALKVDAVVDLIARDLARTLEARARTESNQAPGSA